MSQQNIAHGGVAAIPWVLGTASAQVLSQGATSPAAGTYALVSAYDEIFLMLSVCVVIALVFSLLYRGRVRQEPVEGQKIVAASNLAAISQHAHRVKSKWLRPKSA